MKFWICYVVFLVCMVLGSVLAERIKAQEKDPSYPQTRQWDITEWDNYTSARLSVVDTAGVCIYVLRGYVKDTVAIQAVPKTQLPKGAGCQ